MCVNSAQNIIHPMFKHILNQYCMQTTAYKILKRTIEDDCLFLSVAPRIHTANCPDCGIQTSVIYDHRKHESQVRWETWYGHPIFLLVRKRRFSCKNANCDRDAFTEKLPDISSPYLRYTTRFVSQCLNTLSTQTFLKTQQTHSVSFQTLVGMLSRFSKTIPSQVDWEHELCQSNDDSLSIGIDEHSYRGREMILSVTNTQTGDLLALIPGATQVKLEGFLRSIPSTIRTHIRHVSMDLTNRYATAVKQWCKQARITVDHFHIIQLANRLLWHERGVLQFVGKRWAKDQGAFHLLLKGQERLTAKERKRVKTLLSEPACVKLKRAYDLKEKLRTLFRMQNSSEAVQQFLSLLRQDVWNKPRTTRDDLLTYSKYYRTFFGTLTRFKQEIVTFIETRITNAVTEGINTKIKLFKRMSYGFRNITHYMKRIMLAFHPPLITHHI